MSVTLEKSPAAVNPFFSATSLEEFENIFENSVLNIALEVIKNADLTQNNPGQNDPTEKPANTSALSTEQALCLELKKHFTETYATTTNKLTEIYMGLPAQDREELKTLITSWKPDDTETTKNIRQLLSRVNTSVEAILSEHMKNLFKENHALHLKILKTVVITETDLIEQQIEFLKRKEYIRLIFIYSQTMGRKGVMGCERKKVHKPGDPSYIYPKLSKEEYQLKQHYKTDKMPIDVEIFGKKLLIRKIKVLVPSKNDNDPTLLKETCTRSAWKLIKKLKRCFAIVEIRDQLIGQLQEDIQELQIRKQALKKEYKEKYAEAEKKAREAIEAAQQERLKQIQINTEPLQPIARETAQVVNKPKKKPNRESWGCVIS